MSEMREPPPDTSWVSTVEVRYDHPLAKRDSEPARSRYRWGAQPLPTDGSPPNPGRTTCCGGTVYNAHGFGICRGPRWIGKLRGYSAPRPQRGNYMTGDGS